MTTEFTDMTDAAAALDAGRVSAMDLLADQLDRIDRRQAALNGYVELDAAGAREAAADADRRRRDGRALSPIDGVPVALKDNIDAAGLATRNGSRYGHDVPGDAAVSARLRDAGALILGKLNMDECAIGGATDNPHYGPTVNPWKPGYVPGGSSGGSGSAVAGGLAWAALGTDTLGSVRLPAAYCGVVGLKATLGLIEMRGIVPLSRSLDHVGPLCRSVRDARMLLGVLAGRPPPGWSTDSTRRLAGSKIGVLTRDLDSHCTADVAAAFRAAIADADAAGAETVEVGLADVELDALRHAAFLVIEAEGADALAGPLGERPDAFSEPLKSMLAYGRDLPSGRLKDARDRLARATAALNDLFTRVDFLAAPTAPQTAFPISDPKPTNQALYTGLANIGGGPALSLPCGVTDAGLPLAFQLMAAPYREADLLNAAEDLEAVWGRFTPPA